MKKNISYTIYIKDISEGNEKAFKAVMPEFENAIIYGENFTELEKGTRLTIEMENYSKGMNRINKKEFDFCIKNLGKNEKSALKLTMIDSNMTIYGANFKELEDGINFIFKQNHPNYLHSLVPAR